MACASCRDAAELLHMRKGTESRQSATSRQARLWVSLAQACLTVQGESSYDYLYSGTSGSSFSSNSLHLAGEVIKVRPH